MTRLKNRKVAIAEVYVEASLWNADPSGRLLAGIAGLNSAGGMDVSISCECCLRADRQRSM